MCTSVPSNPPSRDSSAQRPHQAIDLVDVLLLHRLRRLAVSGRLDGGRSPEHAEVVGGVAGRVRAEVVELGEDHAPVSVDARGHRAIDLELALQVLVREARHAGRRGWVDEAVAGDQEPGAAPGTLHLVGDVPVRVDAVLGEELHVSRLEDPVPDGHIPDPEGAEQVWVAAHATSRAHRGRTRTYSTSSILVNAQGREAHELPAG